MKGTNGHSNVLCREIKMVVLLSVPRFHGEESWTLRSADHHFCSHYWSKRNLPNILWIQGSRSSEDQDSSAFSLHPELTWSHSSLYPNPAERKQVYRSADTQIYRKDKSLSEAARQANI